MMRSLVSLAVGTLAFAAVADLREPPVSETERAAFLEACGYYEKRAAASSGAGAGEFVSFLAEACVAAERLLETGTPEQRSRSALLLSRVAELRRTVVRMNADRAAGSLRGTRQGYVPVSPSGEFLIAHRLGVLLAFDAWVETGARISVASYP